jgi:anti-sigma B factor antagonist
MKLTVSDSDSISKVVFEGRLDANSSNETERTLSELIAKASASFLFDLSSMEYVSSAGLRVMLVAAKRIQQKGGRLSLFGLNDNVKEVFDISGFTAVFKIFPDETSAGSFLKS